MVKDIMCGDEAAAARSMLQITYPVQQASPEGVYSVLTTSLSRWKME